MAPNNAEKSGSFLSALFGRKRPTPSTDDSTKKKQKLDNGSVKSTNTCSTNTLKRSGGTKIIFSQEWAASSDDEVQILLPSQPPKKNSTTVKKKKKRLPPTRLYPIKTASPAKKSANFDSDSDDTFATKEESFEEKSTTPTIDSDNDVEDVLKEKSTTPPTSTDDSEDDLDRQQTANQTTKLSESTEACTTPEASTTDANIPKETSIAAETSIDRQMVLLTSRTSIKNNSEIQQKSTSATSMSDDDMDHELQDCSQVTVPTSNTSKQGARVESATSESQLDSSDTETNLLPTIELLKTQCWKCSAKLKLEGEFCLYAMHTHPLLKVPVCCVCADEVLAVELDSTNEGDPTQCSGCGRDEEDVETLFLCDDCPRAFCDACAACCHGGGKEGSKQVELLSKSDEKWFCPFCMRPAPLQSLQEHMECIGEEEESKERSVDDALTELYKVELERKEYERQILPQLLEEKRAEIRAELLVEMASTPMEEIDDAVEAEMEDWEQQWLKHDARLADRVLSLQEEIELHGENLAGCYAAIEGETVMDDDEPEWKKAADAEIQRRKEEEEDADDLSLQNPSHPSIYKKNIPEDVEDLGISDPGENENRRSQWRHGRRRAKKEDMQEALQAEEEMFREWKIPVLRVVDDTEDLEEVKEEERFSSGRAKDGASRVRRDGYQVVVQERASRLRRRRVKWPAKRRRVSSTTSNSSRPKGQSGFVASSDFSDLSDIDSVVESSAGGSIFDNSAFVLSSPEQIDPQDDTSEGTVQSVRTVSIAEPLASKLKAHQVSGVRFMWKTCFADLAYFDPPANIVENVGGCILAHNMGLGKSLACISLLHALLNHPSLVSRTSSERLIRTVLLVVPTNVLSHWENEWEQWTGQLLSPISVFNLGVVNIQERQKHIQKWKRRGGILLVSSSMFVQLVKSSIHVEALHNPGPDIVIADEAHLMLKNSSKISSALSSVMTRRRIALTGSPIQNNLLEYYRMVSWVRPGVLGNSESAFDREYSIPIMAGLASDASVFAVQTSNEASKKLHNLLAPYVQRKDATTLRKDLPPMQQVILHVRQSKTQSRLYSAFASYKKRAGITNFFRSFQMVRPLHNHPGTLLLAGNSDESEEKDGKEGYTGDSPNETGKPAAPVDDDLEINEVSTDAGTEDDVEIVEPASASAASHIRGADDISPLPVDVSGLPENGADTEKECEPVSKGSSAVGLPPSGRKDRAKKEQWWRKTAERHGGIEKLNEVEQGYKVILLLHILREAQVIGDKVLVFSQCLRTLDFLEYVLGLENWVEHVPSLSSSSLQTGEKGGVWKKGVDYLRIDGQTQFSERGELIARFNDGKSSSKLEQKSGGEDKVKAFLLSSTACGIGINLIAANRVVLFDNHFNPTILTQALYRCYRYGQTKPVFAYRFMTEGSVEEKIYSRSVNKTGVALRVIDNKTIARSFSDREVRDLEETDTWVQCDRCEKWRMLPQDVDGKELPEQWFCEINEKDIVNNNCDASEKDRAWYYRQEGQTDRIREESPLKRIARDTADSALSQEEKEKLVEKDVILKKLLTVTASDRQTSVISKHYFHDALLAETEEEFLDDDTGASLSACGEGAQQEQSHTEASASEVTKEQPDRDSLINSTDAVYRYAQDNVSIGSIIASVEAEYGVEFDKATKTIVRKRIKELVREAVKSKKHIAKSEVDAPSTSTTAATQSFLDEKGTKLSSDSVTIASLDDTEAAESNTQTPPRTPEKKLPPNTVNNVATGTMCSSSSNAARSRLEAHDKLLPSDSSPPVHDNSSSSPPRKVAPPARVSTLKKSRGHEGRKQPSTEEEKMREPTPPPNAHPSSPSSPLARATSLPDRDDSQSVKPNRRGAKVFSGLRPPAKEEETNEPSSLYRQPRKSKPEVIELLSDSESTTDDDVVEILSD